MALIALFLGGLWMLGAPLFALFTLRRQRDHQAGDSPVHGSPLATDGIDPAIEVPDADGDGAAVDGQQLEGNALGGLTAREQTLVQDSLDTLQLMRNAKTRVEVQAAFAQYTLAAQTLDAAMNQPEPRRAAADVTPEHESMPTVGASRSNSLDLTPLTQTLDSLPQVAPPDHSEPDGQTNQKETPPFTELKFLSQGLHPRVWYWRVLYFLLKNVLAAIVVFVEAPIIKVLAVTMVIVLFVIMEVYLQPFKNPIEQHFGVFCLLVPYATLTIGFAVAQPKVPYAVRISGEVLVVALNSLLVVVSLVVAGKATWTHWKQHGKLQNESHYLERTLACLSSLVTPGKFRRRSEKPGVQEEKAFLFSMQLSTTTSAATATTAMVPGTEKRSMPLPNSSTLSNVPKATPDGTPRKEVDHVGKEDNAAMDLETNPLRFGGVCVGGGHPVALAPPPTFLLDQGGTEEKEVLLSSMELTGTRTTAEATAASAINLITERNAMLLSSSYAMGTVVEATPDGTAPKESGHRSKGADADGQLASAAAEEACHDISNPI